MSLAEAAARYMKAVEALHSVHGTTDVHDLGGVAGQAITEHCAYICNASGGRVETTDSGELKVIEGPRPHEAVLREYVAAKEELERFLG